MYFSLCFLSILLVSHAIAFSASGNDNVAIYWGQNSAQYGQLPLRNYCDSNAVDIVLLAFMMDFPNWNMHFATSEQSLRTSEGKPYYPLIGADIKYCQSKGKIVLLSLGGALGNYGFQNDGEATQFAATLWNYFGGGNTPVANRPFGDAIIDGFDLDNEDKKPHGYAALVNGLRTQYTNDPSRRYYVSAAPQCVFKDASVGLAMDNSQIDFAFIQFYNNECNLDAKFNWDTWQTWANLESPNRNIKLYVGLPGAPKSAGRGYLSANQVKQLLPRSVLDSPNFGGISIWDMASSFSNVADGENFAELMKKLVARGNGAVGSSTVSLALVESPLVPTVSSSSMYTEAPSLASESTAALTVVETVTVTAPYTITKTQYITISTQYFVQTRLYNPHTV